MPPRRIDSRREITRVIINRNTYKYVFLFYLPVNYSNPVFCFARGIAKLKTGIFKKKADPIIVDSVKIVSFVKLTK